MSLISFETWAMYSDLSAMSRALNLSWTVLATDM